MRYPLCLSVLDKFFLSALRLIFDQIEKKFFNYLGHRNSKEKLNSPSQWNLKFHLTIECRSFQEYKLKIILEEFFQQTNNT